MLVEILINRQKTNVGAVVIRLFSVWLADEGRVAGLEHTRDRQRYRNTARVIKRNSRGVRERELFFCIFFSARQEIERTTIIAAINCFKHSCTLLTRIYYRVYISFSLFPLNVIIQQEEKLFLGIL